MKFKKLIEKNAKQSFMIPLSIKAILSLKLINRFVVVGKPLEDIEENETIDKKNFL